MADVDLQVLLDPDYKLLRRSDYTGSTITSYYCDGRTLGHGRAGWTDVTTLNTDAQKNTAIRAALSIAV